MATTINHSGFPALSPEALADIPAQTYTLSRPVLWGDVFCETLSMREPVVDDSLWMQSIPAESEGVREVCIIARLCGVEPELVRLLSLPDYRRLQKDFAAFFTSSALTENGNQSSG